MSRADPSPFAALLPALTLLGTVLLGTVLLGTVLLVGGCQSTPEAKPDEKAIEPAGPPPLPGARLDLERIFADPPLAGSRPMGVSFSPDGRWLAFLKGSAEDSQVLDLWALALTEDGKAASAPQVLVRTSDLVDTRAIELSEEERMALERKRVRHQGITSYDWCGEGGKTVLFPLSSQLYVVDIAPVAEGLPLDVKQHVKKLTDEGAARLDARCSPSGSKVSFVQEGDLYVIDVATKKPTRLTKGATATRTFGLAEFVAQEEMGRYDAHWWSPDEKLLAYLEVDSARVTVKRRPRIYADRTELYEQRYPAAGEPNAIVKLHVIELKGQKDRVVELPKAEGADPFDFYVPRVGFTPGGELWAQWQSRDQTRLVLLKGAAPAFNLAPLLEERDEAWVELHDDLHFLDDGSFVWPSEAGGVRHLGLRKPDGSLHSALTVGADPVVEVVGVDGAEKRIFYIKATERSTERHLFVTSLAGGDAGPSQERKLSSLAGTHEITASPKGRFFVDTYSKTFAPPKVTVLNREGQAVFVLDENPAEEWAALAKPSYELAAIDVEGTALNALLVPPVNVAEGQQYPVMVYVYGGPHAQIVREGWGRLHPFVVFLAQRGVGTFIVDNRGSGHRDRAFTRAIKNRFGDIEVQDQTRALTWLKEKPWVDDEHVGVFGWSYGGYMSLLLAMVEDSPYAAAVSVAPVTDWTLYDTHYTERYIGRPQENAAVYAKAAVVPRGTRLERPLLLVHGMADDNVLFEHSLKLIETLQTESVPFELMVYPGRAHGLTGRGTQLHVYRSIWRFFARELCTELNGGCRLPEGG